jgi:hypothetical protein
MGWRTDWLYQLLFREVMRIWTRAQKEGETALMGPAPDFLLIQQCADADWENALCRTPVLREWIFRGTTIEAQPLSDSQSTPRPVRRKAFFDYGIVCFHVTTDRKRVLWTYQLGPLYGRDEVLRVRGQGKRGSLERVLGSICWTS